MVRKPKSQVARPANRFYRAAKVSEYQFKRVLWSFVVDEPVAQAARRIRLSANSINAIYTKLRVFFTELGVFVDIYKGGDPKFGTDRGKDLEGFDYRLLTFHLQRDSAKRRMKGTAIEEIDYNWCESNWRFDYQVLVMCRPDALIHRMMYGHLLAFIRACGPVGHAPRHREKAAPLLRQHFEQGLLWLE